MSQNETKRKLEEAKRRENLHADNVATRQTRIRRTSEELKTINTWLIDDSKRLSKLKKEFRASEEALIAAEKVFSEAKRREQRLETEIEAKERSPLLRKNINEKETDERSLRQLETELRSETAKLTVVQNSVRVLNRQETQEAIKLAQSSVANSNRPPNK